MNSSVWSLPDSCRFSDSNRFEQLVLAKMGKVTRRGTADCPLHTVLRQLNAEKISYSLQDFCWYQTTRDVVPTAFPLLKSCSGSTTMTSAICDCVTATLFLFSGSLITIDSFKITSTDGYTITFDAVPKSTDSASNFPAARNMEAKIKIASDAYFIIIFYHAAISICICMNTFDSTKVIYKMRSTNRR